MLRSATSSLLKKSSSKQTPLTLTTPSVRSYKTFTFKPFLKPPPSTYNTTLTSHLQKSSLNRSLISHTGMTANTVRTHATTAISSNRFRVDNGRLSAIRMFKGAKEVKFMAMMIAAASAVMLEQTRIRSLCETDTLSMGHDTTNTGTTTFTQTTKRLLLAAKRILTLTTLFSPLILMAPISYLTGATSISNYTWEYSLWGIEVAGPTFIKLSQWASTRSDLFPQEFCLRFARLQDATRGHSWRETEVTLKESFGSDWREIFELDNTRLPIGSGCIAQVYHGKLIKPLGTVPEGEEIAVKIVHPHIREKVEMDFYIMNKAATFLESLPKLNLKWLSLKDSVEQFRQIMVPQLDLRCEARNLDRFRVHFADSDVVKFPKPHSSLVTRNILVESYVRGDPVLSYLKPGTKQSEKEELAKLGVSTVMQMIFMYDFVHGDLHPGNILITRNKSQKLTLNLLDCGIVVEMGESDHKNLINILGAFIKRDGLQAGKLMVDTAKHTDATEEDVRAFCDGIQKICSDDEDNNFLEKVGDYLADICFLACKHKVKLESKFINAALAVEIMEGLACKLHPGMEVQKVALPLVLKAEVVHGLARSTNGWF